MSQRSALIRILLCSNTFTRRSAAARRSPSPAVMLSLVMTADPLARGIKYLTLCATSHETTTTMSAQ